MSRVAAAQWTEPSIVARQVALVHITLIGGRYRMFTATGADDARLTLDTTNGRRYVTPGAATGLSVRAVGGGRITI